MSQQIRLTQVSLTLTGAKGPGTRRSQGSDMDDGVRLPGVRRALTRAGFI